MLKGLRNPERTKSCIINDLIKAEKFCPLPTLHSEGNCKYKAPDFSCVATRSECQLTATKIQSVQEFNTCIIYNLQERIYSSSWPSDGPIWHTNCD